MTWPGLMIIVILIVIIALLCLKIALLKSSAGEIGEGFEEKIKGGTNSLIRISSRDKDMMKLCSEINEQLIRLRETEIKYEQGDRELKTAITNISHDIRTPLTAINGYLKLIEDEEKSGQAEEYLKIIGERVRAMKALSDELFEYSVISSKKEEENAEPEEVHINLVLEESITAMYAALTHKGIEPEIEITDKRIIRLSDKEALSRVFSNILSNAIKYSEGDLYIKMDDNGVITFSNTASSLTEVEVERLFDRFYTVTNARSSTGLGLSIAKTLAAKANADIKGELIGDKLTITIKV